ncbi:chitin synthase [Malassezia cuniculi]|uniref:chitin synthase n=1 Tax=Malassezia cuniculi TaxID=948313 RepID=A0AAF0EWG2_9BASI|nr:chitin synthase [Malassezia cuniculi]
MTRPERSQPLSPMLNADGTPGDPFVDKTHKKTIRSHWWHYLAIALTFYALPPFMRVFGMHSPSVRQAWREKMALVTIAAIMGAFVIYITMGLHRSLCPESAQDVFVNVKHATGSVGVLGQSYSSENLNQLELINMARGQPGVDLTPFFDKSRHPFPACAGHTGRYATDNTCLGANLRPATTCLGGRISEHNLAQGVHLQRETRMIGYDWGDILKTSEYFMAIDGYVLNMAPYMLSVAPDPNDPVDTAIRMQVNQSAGHGPDATRVFATTKEAQAAIPCLQQRYLAGRVNYDSAGCFVAQLILILSLIIILGVVIIRFIMAVWFHYVGSRHLANDVPELSGNVRRNNRTSMLVHTHLPAEMADATVNSGNAPWAKKQARMSRMGVPGPNGSRLARVPSVMNQAHIGTEPFVICLVTCYSEGAEGIANTLTSLSETDYPANRKLLFVVADGMVTGAGESMSTPDICVSLIEPDMRFGTPTPMSFVSVGAGSKACNMGLVYAGYYTRSASPDPVPIIIVVKCGTAAEATEKKPGNRGKRDSQMVLFYFLQRVTYNMPMTPLDYDLFRKIHALMGVTPDFFEVCLMVDADTNVHRPALKKLCNSMMVDPMIMGACGETRISNKMQSWVTAIQVFEYFISHHQIKAFESVFGGVTCLPGCFSMYRIKARKQNDDDWIPVIVRPEIIREYSQSTVHTLHQKNLLLLGEDRFLSTLMLRTFPHRRMMFVPQACCRTEVPHTFRMLLSQRRRWINSTVHNLMELVLVRDLCGTFCFSMQFVVLMDLIGTLVLPVAIALTYTVIITSIVNPPRDFTSAIPLVMLLVVLFLPGFLIVMAQGRFQYVGWLLIYLIFLPVWNFILPVYSFWHFDDFSWGETRKVEGEAKGATHDVEDEEYDALLRIPMRRWNEWELSRLRKIERDERRRRDLEERYGAGFYNDMPDTAVNSTVARLRDEDRMLSPIPSVTDSEDAWGDQIGTYDETEEPPELIGAAIPESGRNTSMLSPDELDAMLDRGWGEDPDGSGKRSSDEMDQINLEPSSHTDPLAGRPLLPNNASTSSAIGMVQTHARNRSSYGGNMFRMESPYDSLARK